MRVLALVAPFDHTAQQRSAAAFDGLNDTVVMQGRRVSLPVGGAVLSKDVGQLHGWRGHQRLARLVEAVAGLAGGSSLSSGLRVAATTCGDTAV